jgi:hypothetical protein
MAQLSRSSLSGPATSQAVREMTREPPNKLRTFLVRRYGRLYNQLHDLGADLNYIWLLDTWVRTADAFKQVSTTTKSQRQAAKRARTRQLLAAANRCLDVYIEGRKAAAREVNPSDPLLDRNHPQFRSRLNEITGQVLPRIIDDLLREEKELRRLNSESRSGVREENVLEEVFREYFPSPERYRKGGNANHDLSGSFFLLAITEHLGKKRGRFKIADSLLGTIRGPGKGRSPLTLPNDLARKRVERLKYAHPNWKTHVDLMTQYWAMRP